ncbi:phosphotransferase [uncultured Chryseobacterium sp.]|uniref:aminoglycoside phosphotransferase family protein n=1 Tax=uncultured Chryseobacterium sp. TaxID=259322 RepID=UPI0026146D60|nr:phosphotransferase [uncultured Chryseobacterium sp.]
MAEAEKAKLFFENYIGKSSSNFKTLAQSGSERVNYVASSDAEKFIITFNENLRENESFFYFSEVFSSQNLNTPKILKISDDRRTYIQEFLGSQTLSEIIAEDQLSERVKSLVKQTLVQLFELQTKTENIIDYSKTFEYESYDELPIMHDLYYFKNFVADVLEIHYHKSSLLKEFKTLTQKIETLEPKGLMIRDFQARNIMVDENENIHFIDYQGAMKGPLIYDVISFLFQAKANFPEDFKNEMLDFYFKLWSDDSKKVQLKNSVKPIQLIRFMQVLGAYGFRGLIQRKAHFIASIDNGIENLYQFSNSWSEMENFPHLKKVIDALKTEAVQQKIKTIINQ